MEYVDLGAPDHELLFYHFYFFFTINQTILLYFNYHDYEASEGVKLVI